jgi:hypothetical protein
VSLLTESDELIVGTETEWFVQATPITSEIIKRLTKGKTVFTCHPKNGESPYVCHEEEIAFSSGNTAGTFTTTVAGAVTMKVTPLDAADIVDPSDVTAYNSFAADVPVSFTVTPSTVNSVAGDSTRLQFAAFDKHDNDAKAGDQLVLYSMALASVDASFKYVPASGVASSIAGYDSGDFAYAFETRGELIITSHLAATRMLTFALKYCTGDSDCTTLADSHTVPITHVAATPARYNVLGPYNQTVDTAFESTFRLVDKFDNAVLDDAILVLTVAATNSTIADDIFTVSIVDGVGTITFLLKTPSSAYTMGVDQADSPACSSGCFLYVGGEKKDMLPSFKVESGATVRYVIIDPEDGSPTDPSASGSVDTTVTIRIEARDQYENVAVAEARAVTLILSGSAAYTDGTGVTDINEGVGTVVIQDKLSEVVILTLQDADSIFLDDIDLSDEQDVQIFWGAPVRCVYRLSRCKKIHVHEGFVIVLSHHMTIMKNSAHSSSSFWGRSPFK